MAKIPPKELALAIGLALMAVIGTAFIFTIVFAIVGLWLDGHSYTWHHQRFRTGAVDMGLFDLLMTLASLSAGLLTGISVIKTSKK